MSVIQSRRKAGTISFGVNGDNSQTRQYVVECSARMREEDVAIGAFTAAPDPVPRQYSYVGAGMWVNKVTFTPANDTNATLWTATVECGSIAGTDQNESVEDGVENPLRHKVVWWPDTIIETTVILKDRFGKAIVNSAGEEFDIPPTRDRRVPVLNAKKNLATLDDVLDYMTELHDKVNATEIKNKPAGQLKCIEVLSSEPRQMGGTEFFEVVMRFAWKPEGWKLALLQRGYKVKTDDGKLLNAVDDEGSLVAAPVNLDSDGKALAADADPVYGEFDVDPPVDFTDYVEDP